MITDHGLNADLSKNNYCNLWILPSVELMFFSGQNKSKSISGI